MFQHFNIIIDVKSPDDSIQLPFQVLSTSMEEAHAACDMWINLVLNDTCMCLSPELN